MWQYILLPLAIVCWATLTYYANSLRQTWMQMEIYAVAQSKYEYNRLWGFIYKQTLTNETNCTSFFKINKFNIGIGEFGLYVECIVLWLVLRDRKWLHEYTMKIYYVFSVECLFKFIFCWHGRLVIECCLLVIFTYITVRFFVGFGHKP